MANSSMTFDAGVPSTSWPEHDSPDLLSQSKPPSKELKENSQELNEAVICNDCTQEEYCQRHIFPFLDLPTELRVAIYHKALHRHEAINLTSKLPSVLHKSPRIQDEFLRRRRPTSGSDSDAYEGRDVNRERNKRVPRASRDPLTPQILLLCKQVYYEALPILYRDNAFNLHLEFSLLPLTKLRQRTRSLIRHVLITIYEHSDVLNGGFNDIFTNGLRYCFGLETLEIIAKVPMPRDRGYDMNFHILRWLPKACKVEVKGDRVSEGVRRMIDEQNMLAQKLDLVRSTIPSYQRVSTYSGTDTDLTQCARSHDHSISRR